MSSFLQMQTGRVVLPMGVSDSARSSSEEPLAPAEGGASGFVQMLAELVPVEGGESAAGVVAAFSPIGGEGNSLPVPLPPAATAIPLEPSVGAEGGAITVDGPPGPDSISLRTVSSSEQPPPLSSGVNALPTDTGSVLLADEGKQEMSLLPQALPAGVAQPASATKAPPVGGGAAGPDNKGSISGDAPSSLMTKMAEVAPRGFVAAGPEVPDSSAEPSPVIRSSAASRQLPLLQPMAAVTQDEVSFSPPVLHAQGSLARLTGLVGGAPAFTPNVFSSVTKVPSLPNEAQLPASAVQDRAGLPFRPVELLLDAEGELDPARTDIRSLQLALVAAGKKESAELLPGGTAPAASVPNPVTGGNPALTGSSPSLLLSPPMGSPQWQHALGERVTWMVRQDLQQAELRLNPRHLGPVEVRIEVRNEQASVTFSAHHAVTRDVLEAAIPRLREMLGEAGLALANADISHQQHSQGQAGGEGASQPPFPAHQEAGEGHHAPEAVLSAGYRAADGGSGLIDLFV